MLGDRNLIPYNCSKNRSAWRNVECYKTFECVSRYQLVLKWSDTTYSPTNDISVKVMDLSYESVIMREELFEDHNSTPYNGSKNRFAGCDIECH